MFSLTLEESEFWQLGKKKARQASSLPCICSLSGNNPKNSYKSSDFIIFFFYSC